MAAVRTMAPARTTAPPAFEFQMGAGDTPFERLWVTFQEDNVALAKDGIRQRYHPFGLLPDVWW
jgi:hypothetical protein